MPTARLSILLFSVPLIRKINSVHWTHPFINALSYFFIVYTHQMTFTHDCIITTTKLFLERKKSLVPPINYARMNTLYSLKICIYKKRTLFILFKCWQLIRPYDQVLTHIVVDDIHSCWKIRGFDLSIEKFDQHKDVFKQVACLSRTAYKTTTSGMLN